jgi:N-methylhydantoinase A
VDRAGSIVQSKVPSIHASSPVIAFRQPAETMELSLDGLPARAGHFGHGTRIGTSLVVERQGAKVGLVAKAGFGDALLMMRGRDEPSASRRASS